MTQPIKILIVEDSPMDAELLVLHLARGGYAAEWERVDTASGFTRRLDASLDLIFSDYRMPGFSGIEALRLLKASGLDLPFIIVSGSINEKEVSAAMQAGATDFLLKDRLGRLGETVTKALERRRTPPA
jgi:CheY-like chemotaxis protein